MRWTPPQTTTGIICIRVDRKIDFPNFKTYHCGKNVLLYTDEGNYSKAFGNRGLYQNCHPPPNFHITSTGRCLNLDRSNLHRPPLHEGYSDALGSNSRDTGHESVTWTIRLPRPHYFLQLTDATFCKPGHIDALIGCQWVFQILKK
ncbi:hypothetical protein TNCV_1247991 [Trichonephila clavipes]|nr:hypothetical protein TNCV_1247991 [Trichonephila clavipes]